MYRRRRNTPPQCWLSRVRGIAIDKADYPDDPSSDDRVECTPHVRDAVFTSPSSARSAHAASGYCTWYRRDRAHLVHSAQTLPRHFRNRRSLAL
jgi:hypothetical protein